MKQLKKTLLTLVALLAVTTGAWADEKMVTINLSTMSSGAVTATGFKTILENIYVGPDPATITTSEGVITKLVIKKGSLYANNFTEDNVGVTPGTITYGSNEITVTDINAESVTLSRKGSKNWSPSSVDVYYAEPSPSSGPKVAWDKDKKTGSFTMPGGNVTLEPEYYPQATLAFQGLTATVDAAAKTEAPLAVLADGAVTGGTLMYYVATDKNFSQADAIALAETQWSAAIPTAETIEAAGTYIMWYYIKGDAEHSDTDPVPLAVTLLPEPTYAVTFAEGTPETDKWTASPNTGVTKGQTVNVTYTGSKKVIGVKAEKKAKPAGPITVTWNPSDIVPKSPSDHSFTKDGITFTAATCDFQKLTFGGGGTFTTTIGNFTKIEISADFTGDVSGTGWSNDGWQSATWTGNAASVSFSGDIWGGGMTCEGGNLKIVFTIE